MPLSDWWPRVGAMLLDGVILFVPSLVINGVISALIGGTTGGAALEFVVAIVVGGSYFGFLNGTGSGQTPGNKAANIAVRDVATNEVIGASRGWLRWFVRFALYLFLLLPGLLNDLWPLWDKQHQSLADKAARSVMIRMR